MHLDLDEDTGLLRDGARAFAKERVRPQSRAWEEAGRIDAAALDEAWQLGFASLGVPAEYGGAADKPDARPSALVGAVVLEELAWADLGFALASFSPMHVTVPVALFGGADLKKETLPKLLGGELPSATGAWIEPSRGYDPWTMGARTEPTPAGPSLRGRKTLVPRADAAELTLVMARSGGAGSDGVEAFLLDGKNPSGATRGPRCDVIAPRAVATFDIALEGVTCRRVAPGPDAHGRLAERALVASAAAAVGVGRAATEYAAEYAKERRAFGRAIAQNQSIAFMIAESAMDMEAAKWMTHKAAWKIDRGERARAEAGRAARLATSAAFRAADSCVQILGGHGVIRDHLAELFFRNARTLARTVGWFMV